MHITVTRTLCLAASAAKANRRYERKFLIEDMDRAAVENIVRFHPAFFAEVYHRRWVNNIYFDSPSLDNFQDNVSGFSQHRVKVRIRWYGDLWGEVKKPILELKIKRSWLNWKMSFPIPSFDADTTCSKARLRELFRTGLLPESLRQSLQGMVPALVNRYRRNYFQSRDRLFRVTIDSELAFHEVTWDGRPSESCHHAPSTVILELKYAEDADRDAHIITQFLPFRLTRSSKYVMGIHAVRRIPIAELYLLPSQD